MTAGISLISGKTGAHRAPLQLLEPSFPQPVGILSQKFLYIIERPDVGAGFSRRAAESRTGSDGRLRLAAPAKAGRLHFAARICERTSDSRH
jgi:hypothetical protein